MGDYEKLGRAGHEKLEKGGGGCWWGGNGGGRCVMHE